MEKTSPISLADDDVCFVLDQRGGGGTVVMIVWKLDLQLHVQSVPKLKL